MGLGFEGFCCLVLLQGILQVEVDCDVFVYEYVVGFECCVLGEVEVFMVDYGFC